MASNSGMFASIKQLKGRENYETWSFRVRAYLQHEELWDCVEGTETDAKKLMKTKTKLELLVDDSIQSHIRTATTAKEIWDKLKKSFTDNGALRRMGLLDRITMTKLMDCESVEAYVDVKMSTAHQLENTGLTVPDEWLGMLLLHGLPDHYRPMIMGLEASGIELTADVVKAKILQEVKIESDEKCDGAYFSRSRATKSKSNESNERRIRCYECNGIGHIARHCSNRKAKGTEHEAKENESKAEETHYAFNSVCLSTTSTGPNDWVIDSGCTAHLTMRKDWLRNIRPSPTKTVIVADKYELPIECIGDIEMRIQVGNRTRSVTVTDVQYTPKLCTNLLSVNRMLRSGNRVIFDENICRIHSGTGELIATASLENNLYTLDRTSCYRTDNRNEKTKQKNISRYRTSGSERRTPQRPTKQATENDYSCFLFDFEEESEICKIDNKTDERNQSENEPRNSSVDDYLNDTGEFGKDEGQNEIREEASGTQNETPDHIAKHGHAIVVLERIDELIKSHAKSDANETAPTDVHERRNEQRQHSIDERPNDSSEKTFDTSDEFDDPNDADWTLS